MLTYRESSRPWEAIACTSDPLPEVSVNVAALFFAAATTRKRWVMMTPFFFLIFFFFLFSFWCSGCSSVYVWCFLFLKGIFQFNDSFWNAFFTSTTAGWRPNWYTGYAQAGRDSLAPTKRLWTLWGEQPFLLIVYTASTCVTESVTLSRIKQRWNFEEKNPCSTASTCVTDSVALSRNK